MTAIYTFDVFATLDGFGSYGEGGDWGGYWGKQGPEFLDRRLAFYGETPRLVLGATTYRQFLEILGPSIEESDVRDPVNTMMRSLPTTVVSKTLEGPSPGRTRRWTTATPSTSSPGSKRSPTYRCARPAACP